jgi:glycosyltransferase involved in cell wall biosynthesis
MTKNRPHIALLMMVRNEHKRLHVSLNSVIGHVDSIVIFDTGSQDNTIEILETFSKEHNIPLRLKQGEFVNFEESRNVSLDFADTFKDIDYVLLLDTNDELRGGDKLRSFVNSFDKLEDPKKSTGFLVCQEWFSGAYDKYYNMRFVKAREGWRYRGSVHEYMVNTKFIGNEQNAPQVYRIDDSIVLFQDRTQDDDKSSKRYARDKELLLKDYLKDPKEPRTLFYLAQTLACLGELEDSIKYYLERTLVDGFLEEKFHAFLRAGDLSEKTNKPWEESMGYYMKSFHVLQRVEPLIKLAEYYLKKNQWILAFMFINLACSLPFPDKAILFIDKNAYDYKRWHILGIVGWYSGHFKEGKIGAMNAIKSGNNNELDTKNLKFYEDREKRLNISGEIIDEYSVNQQNINNLENTLNSQQSIQIQQPLTKTQFMNKTIEELSKTNPGLTLKQKTSRANLMWKKRNKK